MPRPPLLPTIDWRFVAAEGRRFDDWLADAEFKEHAERMRAIHASTEILAEVASDIVELARDVQIVAIAEDWCGDVVRHAPVLEKVAALNSHIRIRYIRRDFDPSLFARYLTNGGEAIPRFIFLNDQFVETGNWGPMPAACRRLIARGKAAGDIGAARKKVSALYEADPHCHAAQREFASLILDAAATGP